MFTPRNVLMSVVILIAGGAFIWFWNEWTLPSDEEMQASVEQAHYYQDHQMVPPTPNHEPNINGLTVIILAVSFVGVVAVLAGLEALWQGWKEKRRARIPRSFGDGWARDSWDKRP